ncbi:MAG: PHP domain-containing protein [Clostridia bacterium]|nr:PHP domain-containing protein [Clostridia bacterium]
MNDLHCHTKISDCSMTIRDVIQLAKNVGVKYLGITDHDTTSGLKEAVILGAEAGVNIIPGIEISAFDYKRNKKAHILGFYIEAGHPAIENICRTMVQRRSIASQNMVNRIIDAGYKITWKQVESYAEGGTGVYKQHIMHALLDMGYCTQIYCDLYKRLFSRSYDSGIPGIAYTPIEYIDVIQAIKAVKAAGGVAVLAHPGQYGNFDAVGEWVSEGLDGIEAYHPSHNAENEDRCLEIAEKYNLVLTGGSDFHGAYGEKPVKPGCRKLGMQHIEELKDRSIKSRREMLKLYI